MEAAAGTGAGIVVVGSANADLVLGVQRVPRAGETVLADGRRTVAGGKGANQAVAAARDGQRVRFVGAVGADDAGDLLREVLTASGVDTALLRRSDAPTGLAVVLLEQVSQDGGGADNAIVVEPGANGTVTALTADDLAAVRAADVLLCQLEVPLVAVAAALTQARAAGVRTVLNAAPARPLPAEVLERVDVLVVNESEAELLGGARSLLSSVPTVALTLGPRGAVVLRRDRPDVVVPAPAVRPVDTTGAGDTFCGVLAGRLAAGVEMEQALSRAVRAASLAVTRPGAVPSIPTAAETDAAGGSTPEPGHLDLPGQPIRGRLDDLQEALVPTDSTMHPVVHLLHDAGLAIWTGGSLMGAVGLNGAAATLDDPGERARVSTRGWSRWAPVSTAALAAHLAGGAGLTLTDLERIRRQKGVLRSSLIKGAATGVTAGLAAWDAALNRRMAAAGRVPVAGATEPSAQTPADVARTQRQLRVVQWLNPAAGLALLALTAWHEEQQRTVEQAKGRLQVLAGSRALRLGAAGAGLAGLALLATRRGSDDTAPLGVSSPDDVVAVDLVEVDVIDLGSRDTAGTSPETGATTDVTTGGVPSTTGWS